jgi:hypothetical protein
MRLNSQYMMVAQCHLTPRRRVTPNVYNDRFLYFYDVFYTIPDAISSSLSVDIGVDKAEFPIRVQPYRHSSQNETLGLNFYIAPRPLKVAGSLGSLTVLSLELDILEGLVLV